MHHYILAAIAGTACAAAVGNVEVEMAKIMDAANLPSSNTHVRRQPLIPCFALGQGQSPRRRERERQRDRESEKQTSDENPIDG